MRYRILPRYWDEWGYVDSMESSIVTDEEIEELSSDWGTPVEELMEMVTEFNVTSIWYAVLEDPDDNWERGSNNFEEAKEMLYKLGDGLIAVIDANDAPRIVNKITYDEIFE